MLFTDKGILYKSYKSQLQFISSAVKNDGCSSVEISVSSLSTNNSFHKVLVLLEVCYIFLSPLATAAIYNFTAIYFKYSGTWSTTFK